MWVVGLGLIQLVEGLKREKLRFPGEGILSKDCYVALTHTSFSIVLIFITLNYLIGNVYVT